MCKFRIVFLLFLSIFFAANISAEAENEIVFAISPMASPASTLASYSDFIEYLSEKTFYTSSHEKSVESVAYGLAAGAAVDSLIFEDMKRMIISFDPVHPSSPTTWGLGY